MDDLLQIFEDAKFGKQAAPAMSPDMRRIRNALERATTAEQVLRDDVVQEAERARGLSADADMSSLTGKGWDIAKGITPGGTEAGEGLRNPTAHLAAVLAGGGAGTAVGMGIAPGAQTWLARRAGGQLASSQGGLASAKELAGLATGPITKATLAAAKEGPTAATRSMLQSAGKTPWKRFAIPGALLASAPFALANWAQARKVRKTGGQEAIDARSRAEEALQKADMFRRWRKAQLIELGAPEDAFSPARVAPDKPRVPRPPSKMVPFAPFARHQQVDVSKTMKEMGL